MKRPLFGLAVIALILLVGCAPAVIVPTASATLMQSAAPSPLPLQAKDYVVKEDMLENDCVPDGTGLDNSNELLLEAREDGEAYLEATGRIEGWVFQYNCSENPRTVVSVANIYESSDGPILALSREWHSEVWDLIDEGLLEHLQDIPELGENQIVFRDPNGFIGIEFAYENTYLFVTGTGDDEVDHYDFFAELAIMVLERAKTLNPN